jgi:hypothetical protein
MGREDDGGHHRSKKRKHSHEDDRGVKRDDRLPFNARALSKDDMDKFGNVFARYLKDKKDINIDEISSSEAYGRFKSFVRKWYQTSNVMVLTLGMRENCQQSTMILSSDVDSTMIPKMKHSGLTTTRTSHPKNLDQVDTVSIPQTTL